MKIRSAVLEFLHEDIETGRHCSEAERDREEKVGGSVRHYF
jgi:hypothetical protein